MPRGLPPPQWGSKSSLSRSARRAWKGGLPGGLAVPESKEISSQTAWKPPPGVSQLRDRVGALYWQRVILRSCKWGRLCARCVQAVHSGLPHCTQGGPGRTRRVPSAP